MGGPSVSQMPPPCPGLGVQTASSDTRQTWASPNLNPAPPLTAREPNRPRVGGGAERRCSEGVGRPTAQHRTGSRA